MNRLHIELPEPSRSVPPGSILEGHVSWNLDQSPKNLTLSLHCLTEGNCNPEDEIAASVSYDAPAAGERRPFQIRLPGRPFSYNGLVFRIRWELELRCEPVLADPAVIPIVLSPGGHPVRAVEVKSRD